MDLNSFSLYVLILNVFLYRKVDPDSLANRKSKTHVASKFQTVRLKLPGEVKVNGVGGNIKQAKQAAAKYVVRKLKESRDLQ